MAENTDEQESFRNKIAIQVAKKRVGEAFTVYYNMAKENPFHHDAARKVEHILLRTARELNTVINELRESVAAGGGSQTGDQNDVIECEPPPPPPALNGAQKAASTGVANHHVRDAVRLRAIGNLQELISLPSPGNQAKSAENRPPLNGSSRSTEPPNSSSRPTIIMSQPVNKSSSQHKTVRRLVQKARTTISEKPPVCVSKPNHQGPPSSTSPARPNTYPRKQPPSSFRKVIPFKKTTTRPMTAASAPQPPPRKDHLSEETIQSLYAQASTSAAFATNLMIHLFSTAELQAVRNVYGRGHGRPPKHKSAQSPNPGALDLERVNLIRRTVESFGGARRDIWSSCVLAMNVKINNLKKANPNATRIA